MKLEFARNLEGRRQLIPMTGSLAAILVQYSIWQVRSL